MKILIVCNAAMSSSMLETPMRDYIKDNNLSGTLDATALASLNPKTINSYDVVVLTPQIAYNLDKLEKVYPDATFYKIPGPFYYRLMAEKGVKPGNTCTVQEEFWNILSEMVK